MDEMGEEVDEEEVEEDLDDMADDDEGGDDDEEEPMDEDFEESMCKYILGPLKSVLKLVRAKKKTPFGSEE